MAHINGQQQCYPFVPISKMYKMPKRYMYDMQNIPTPAKTDTPQHPQNVVWMGIHAISYGNCGKFIFYKKTLAIFKNICQYIRRNASVAQLARAQPCQG